MIDVKATLKESEERMEMAAMFLEEFVGKDIPWAHLDIAAADYAKSCFSYYADGATGFGARTLASLIYNL